MRNYGERTYGQAPVEFDFIRKFEKNKNGLGIAYYPNGNKRWERIFPAPKGKSVHRLISRYTDYKFVNGWDDKGEQIIIDGNGPWTSIYNKQNYCFKSVGEYKNGLRNGKWTFYRDNGEIDWITIYENGRTSFRPKNSFYHEKRVGYENNEYKIIGCELSPLSSVTQWRYYIICKKCGNEALFHDRLSWDMYSPLPPKSRCLLLECADHDF